jgi:hypothetical protein
MTCAKCDAENAAVAKFSIECADSDSVGVNTSEVVVRSNTTTANLAVFIPQDTRSTAESRAY